MKKLAIVLAAMFALGTLGMGCAEKKEAPKPGEEKKVEAEKKVEGEKPAEEKAPEAK